MDEGKWMSYICSFCVDETSSWTIENYLTFSILRAYSLLFARGDICLLTTLIIQIPTSTTQGCHSTELIVIIDVRPRTRVSRVVDRQDLCRVYIPAHSPVRFLKLQFTPDVMFIFSPEDCRFWLLVITWGPQAGVFL